MATCKTCKKEFGIFELKGGKCKDCIQKETPACYGCGKNFKKEDLINGFCRPCSLKEQQKDIRDLKKQIKELKEVTR